MPTKLTDEMLSQLPDARGHFGAYGGRFVSETLMDSLMTLEREYLRRKTDPEFQAAFDNDLAHYVGRPSPLYFAERLTRETGGAQIWLKREDLNHTGAHKVNNTIGQALLASFLGKTRVIAETGAGQQSLNVYRMKLLGAEVHAVESGTRTLKDAMNDAMRDWVANVDDTFYIIGTVAGPHPYPLLVRDFQAVIGRETRQQALEQAGKLPDALVACVGGGSNAIGMFYPFLTDESVKLYGVEAGGLGLETGQHAAPLAAGRPGVLHGNRTYLMEDENGQIAGTHSVSAGLDYPGVGPEHSWLKDIGRAEYVSVTDDEALAAFRRLTRVEGIMPALETAHAVAYAIKLAAEMEPEQMVVINISGRGDKDIHTIAQLDGIEA